MTGIIEILLYVLMCLIGFCAAGIASTMYAIFINARPRFDDAPQPTDKAVLHVLLLLFAGPLVITRNAVRAWRRHHTALGWVAASSSFAAAWCLLSGVLILTIIDYARAALA